MNNFDMLQHVKGESLFTDDFIEPSNLQFVYVVSSDFAHGKIINIDYSEVLKYKDGIRVLTAKDIPGENQIGGIIQDETLLAEDFVDYIGQPIALVIANDLHTARQAAKHIKIEIEELPAIFDAREAFQKGMLIIPPVVFESGDVDSAWNKCDFIFSDTVESGGQEHLYLETQISLAIPTEGKGLKIISSTQAPALVQKIVARVLNIPMYKIEVDVLRLGGGFGGKEDQATQWAALAALAAFNLNNPVKLILHRQEDMIMTGKRHPYSSDFKIGLNKEGKILAYQVTFYQNSGASADLSTAILERTLFHSTNSYFIPNVKAKAICCKTNLPPNTAFRGFGGPQGMFVIESAIFLAAEKMGILQHSIQENNLFQNGDEFYYGQKIENSVGIECWNSLKSKVNLDKISSDTEKFNSENKFCKKGFAFMPLCFGISFTSTGLNQSSSLVHIYTDGSVSVSTGAVEMGQGVNMKMRQIPSNIFSIPIDKIKVESTNTSRVANSSPTAASCGADLNGKATESACSILLNGLIDLIAIEYKIEYKEKITFNNGLIFINGSDIGLTWEMLIEMAYWKRVSLSAQAFYSTPGIFFDRSTKKGHPFAYHVYGSALIQVSLDCLRGIYEIDSIDIVHDFGKSMNPVIDKGQLEGALMQGIGWLTIEEIKHNVNGKLLNDTLSTYKIPDIYFTPKKINIEFFNNPYQNRAIFNSKAIGEPPFMYGIGIYFAILNAIKSFRKNTTLKFSAPLTHEKVLLSLYE